EEQVIVTRRGAGTTIAPDASAAAEKAVAARPMVPTDRVDPQLLELIAAAVATARAGGHGDAQILRAVRQALGEADRAWATSSPCDPATARRSWPARTSC